MVNRNRMTDEFLELLRIDSISLYEKEMARLIRKKLEELGLEIYEDQTAEKIGGNSGNLIATLKGSRQSPVVLFSAHMDTVIPGRGKKPQLQNGVFCSDGTTVLGGDNIAGVEIILEALRILQEDGIQHGDIQVAFTVAEELYLLGASYMDFSKISACYAIVLDCAGKPGTIALRAPMQYEVDVTVKGKAAHAGIEPEKGINAAIIAGEALSNMKLGRIDACTTANIGMVNGGSARNIICDAVEIKGEARSLDEGLLMGQLTHMKKCFEEAAVLYGGKADFVSRLKYPALNVNENEEIIAILKTAAEECGIDPVFISTGGGSDANILSSKGIMAVNIGIGMEDIHTTDEKISLDDMSKSVEFLVVCNP